MKVEPVTLTTICESIALRGSLAAAARAADIAESTLHKWVAESKRAFDARDEASPMFFQWRERDDFFHRHILKAKAEGVLGLLHQTLDHAKNGIEEVIHDPSTGRPLPKLDPEFLGVSDAEMVAMMLHPVRDRWVWRLDAEGNRIEPEPATRFVRQAASITQTALRGFIPKVFGDSVDHKIAVSGQVIHRIAVPDFVSRHAVVADAPHAEPVIDAEFTDAPQLPKPAMEMRPDILELRAQAAELLSRSDRVTKPQGPVHVFGRNEGDNADKVTGAAQPRPASEHARAYTRPASPSGMAPTSPRPPNGFPAGTDPTGRVAMKVR